MNNNVNDQVAEVSDSEWPEIQSEFIEKSLSFDSTFAIP